MKVTMLDTVEDANFHPGEEEAKRHPAHAMSQSERKSGDKILGCHRIDLLKKDETYDLPDWQAKRLIELKVAALPGQPAE